MARIPRRMAGIGAADIPDAAAFDAYVGPARELTVDPARGIARLHDGSTPGGKNLVSESASVIAYDNDASGLAAENLQDAIDELADRETLPAGGATGEVLAKASATDGDAEWVPAFSRAGGFLFGLTLSNNVSAPNTRLNVSSGSCRSLSGSMDLVLDSGMTVDFGSWNEANGGGLDTGSAPVAGQGYHAHLVYNPTTGLLRTLLSTSATNPAMPSGYTERRRLGAVLIDDSGNIRAFTQVGGWFMLKTAINLSVTWGNLGGNSPSLKSAAVPTGVKLMAKILAATTSSSAGYVAVTDPDLGAPTLNQMAAYYQLASSLSGMRVDVWTNASGQVYAGHSGANATTNNIFLQGWYDIRDTSV